MKRIAWLLLVCLILSLFPVAGAAAGEITISTADQLRRIGIDASYPMNGTYRLTADVDLSDAEWKAIGHKGDAIVPFTGTFDGDGYKIIGMTTGKSAAYSQGKDGWGLFAQLNGATVKNLVLDEVWLNVFSAGNYNAVGAVAGYVGGGARIENVMVRSGLVRDTGSRQIRLGGIAGSTVGRVFLMYHYFTRESGMFNDGATYLDPVSSKKLHEVLRKYPDVIYFSGHNHFSFDCDMNIHNNGTYTSIHTPSLAASTAYKGKGHEMGNEGYFVEVYADYVIVRGVDFLTDETVSKATFLLGKASDLTISDPNGAANATDPTQSTSTASSDGNSAPLGLILGIGGGLIGLAAAATVLLLIKKKNA